MSSNSTQAVHLTQDDLNVMGAIARYQGLTAAIIQQTFFPGRTSKSVYRTLRRLVTTGLVEDLGEGPSNNHRPRSLPALYVLTRLGRDVAGSHLRVRAVSKALAHHVVAVAEVGLDAERSGHKVVTDREIEYEINAWRRSNDPLPPHGLWLGGQDERLGRSKADARRRLQMWTHRPDLVVVEDHAGSKVRTAVEVELSVKDQDRLAEILWGYARDTMFARVLYVVADEKMRTYLTDRVAYLPPQSQTKFEVVVHVPRYAEWVTATEESLTVPENLESASAAGSDGSDMPWYLKACAPGMW